MRIEVYIFNSIKRLILKIPVIRYLFVMIESYLFDVFKIFNLRHYFGKSLKNSNVHNEKLILNFKEFYNRNYYDESINAIIKYLEERTRSSWRGHHYFALWLVKELKPTTIVDLGTHKGFSTFMFAAQKIGKVYCIDFFMAMNVYRQEQKKERADYIPCMRNKRKMEKKFGIQNVTIIKGKFSEVVEKWKIPIDILHIDGTHRYEDIKEDYQNWSKFLNANSVVLFHDTNIFEGAKQFFNELELPKYNFTHSYGLGVVSKNKDLIFKIKKMWDICP